MNITTAKRIIELSAKTGEPILMIGDHGIGKSEIVKQIAKENNMHLEILFLSHQEISDLIGIQYMEEVNGKKVTKWSVPEWLQRMYDAAAEGKRCLLFLDELNRAQLDVRQSALQIVLDGKIHEHTLPITNNEKTFIMSAINPHDDDYQVFTLDTALLDRFLTINIEADAKSWIDWAHKNNIHKSIISFISKNPEKLNYRPENGSKGSTPRALAKLSAFINLDEDIDDVLLQIICGKIGIEVGLLFYNYLEEHLKMISIEDIEDFVNTEYKNDSNIKIEDLGLKIKEFTKDVEVQRKIELANQMFSEYETAQLGILLAFMYSLEIETLHTLLLEFRDKNEPKYDEFAALDDKMNKKALFMRIFSKIKVTQ